MKVRVQVVVTREIEFDTSEVYAGQTEEQIVESEKNYAENLFHEWQDAEGVTYETSVEVIEGLPEAIETTESA